jgi:Fe-S cluster assembly iron-binding protein IscA
MFALTASATTALIAARLKSGIPATWGIRFFEPAGSESDLTFDFVATPEHDDVVGGSTDLRTYVDAAVDRSMGDATVDYQMVDGKSGIVIRPYPAGRAAR